MIQDRRARSALPSASLLLFLPLLLAGQVRAQAPSLSRPTGEARVPNLVGASGLLQTPSAYVQRSAEVAAFFAGTSDSGSGGALVGVANRLELGLMGSGSSWDSAKLLGSAKLNLLPEQLMLPAVSVGVLDAWNARDDISGYAVVSKYVIPYFLDALIGQQRLALKLHAGYGGGIYSHNLLAGAEILDAGGLGALGELANGRLNVGARYSRQGFAATIALLDWKSVGGSISYTIALTPR